MNESKAYLILSRVDLAEGGNWQQWLNGTGQSEEMILGIYATPEGAHEGILTARDNDDTKGYALQSFCSCCGKHASQNTIWYDPEKKQLFGAVV